MEARPTVQTIRADHAANFPEFMAYVRTRFAPPVSLGGGENCCRICRNCDGKRDPTCGRA
jgi:hypothetical protein